MIITLHGKDSYGRKSKVDELVKNYKSKHNNIDVMFFDLSESENKWEEAQGFLKQPSMFVSSKLAVIKNVTKEEKKEWLNTLKNYLENNKVFIIISEKNKPNKKFNFLLKNPAKSQEFTELKEEVLKKFILKKSKELNLSFSLEAVRFLMSYAMDNKSRGWLLVNELEKIKLAEFNSPVKMDDIKKLIEWRGGEEMYSVISKILYSRNTSQGLSYLEGLFLRGKETRHMFNLLTYQAIGENAEILSKYDISIKLGGLEYEEALVSFLLDRK